MLKFDYPENVEYIVDEVSLTATKIKKSLSPSGQPSISSSPSTSSSPTFIGENLALFRPSSQRSTIYGLSSDLAVDGDVSTDTHTGYGINYWEVDLESTAIIIKVKIFQEQKQNKLWIEVLDSNNILVERKDWDVESAPKEFEFEFDAVVGRFVRIREKIMGWLSLSEVEVYGKFLVDPLTPPPSNTPTEEASVSIPSSDPTEGVSSEPTKGSAFPSEQETDMPTNKPTSEPTDIPTFASTEPPSAQGTSQPTTGPPTIDSDWPTLSPILSLSPSSDPWLIQNTMLTQDGNTLNVSQDINKGPEKVKLALFKANCVLPIEDNDIVSVIEDPKLIPAETVTYSLLLNQNKLETSNNVKFHDGTNTTGNITFCSKLMFQTDLEVNVTSKKLNFLIEFDMTNNFTFKSPSIVSADNVIEQQNGTITFEVKACECDATTKCVTKTYTKSERLRVCITPESKSVTINNMMLTMTSETGGEYKPVTFGVDEPMYDDNTKHSKFGSTTMITTSIVDQFFDGSNEITFAGIVYLSVGAGKTNDFEVLNLNIQIDKEVVVYTEPVGCFESLLKLIGFD